MTAPAPARGWMSAAACVDYPQDWWFATSGRDRDRARAICVECPVRIQCLNYALELGERHGIWGGVTEHARRSMRRQWVRRCRDCGEIINTRGTRLERCETCRPQREREMRLEIRRRYRLRTIG